MRLISLGNKFSFEYLYMFIMIIYMAQMTADTTRMIGGLGGNLIPLLIPIVMSLYLLKRNPISFRCKKFQLILCIVTIWVVLFFIKQKRITTEDLSYIFFLYYAIVIAYIHIRVFGQNYFYFYEDIMVKFCKIALILWLFSLFWPNATALFRSFPSTGYGNNVLYLFNWMDPVKGQGIRNAGCSWEPGRFAIMIVLAVFVNLSQNGIKFKKNNNIIFLLLTLLSTQSTTGVSSVLLLYFLFYVKQFNFKKILGVFFLGVPLILGVFSLEFMGAKILKQLDVDSKLNEIQISINWMNKTRAEGEYAFSMDRFPAMVMEWENVLHDPILGYGRNTDNSYFYKSISSHITLTGGIIKVIGQYGLIFGVFFYYILYLSSKQFAKDSIEKRSLALFLIFLLFSISYVTFCTPVFTAFWFYGLFKKDESIYYY